ncbi:DUF4097 family beta strand repeat-containing protein [Bacillus sp. FJAT-47783]|uniref:DUF4097 family beta strand repeat-containing protein n=1 Tax=Bacillus sp. FJAT-47783 TaxID=2922712 RepID=UPI001FADDCB6|nr:DUF4097 family beta strand repeat-containing protein [Bacillus sp. FJAT-47783]
MKKVVKIGILLVVIGLIGTVSLLISGVGFKQEEVMEQKEIDGREIQNISIKTDLANIYLKPVKAEQIYVEIIGKTTRELNTVFSTSTDHRTLEISMEQKRPWLFNASFGFNSDSLDLHVSLPEKMYNTLNMETELGNISSDHKFMAKNAIFKTDLGNIELTGFEGEKITADTSLGDIIINELNATFHFQAETGDIDIYSVKKLTDTNTIRTEMGDANVTLSQDPQPLNMDLSTELGDINTNLSVTTTVSGGEALKDITSQTLKGQYGEVRKNSPSLVITTELGDITLKK